MGSQLADGAGKVKKIDVGNGGTCRVGEGGKGQEVSSEKRQHVQGVVISGVEEGRQSPTPVDKTRDWYFAVGKDDVPVRRANREKSGNGEFGDSLLMRREPRP